MNDRDDVPPDRVIRPDARTRLADGRTLLYYDDVAGADRSASDSRPLVALESEPELRYNALLGEWVIIAPHRQERTYLPPESECPLCPSRERATEIPASDYDVVVFENRFPSLVSGVAIDGPPDGTRRPGIGKCEVICFSSDHHATFAGLGAARLRTVSRALIDRTLELGTLPGVEYVLCFENRGEEIGVTLNHPHGQIYAYPFIPAKIDRTLAVAADHQARTGECLMCSLVARELADGDRLVAAVDDFVAFVPFAPRWPFEVHIVPTRHVTDVPALAEGSAVTMLELQARVLRAFDRLFPSPAPYIAGFIQAPVTDRREVAHLYAEVFTPRRAAGKLKYLAGSESLAGAVSNDVIPETAAEMLRQVLAE